MIVPRKILAIKLRALGDTVLMTAPLMELRNAHPHAEIHVVVTQSWAKLLENHPAVDKIWLYERHSSATSRMRAITRLALQIRKEKFDWAINFHASPSSSTLTYASGAKVRSIHFHGHRVKNRYSTVEVPGKGVLKPIIERDMDAVRALEIPVSEGKMPRIFLSEDEKKSARERLERFGLKPPYLCLGIGASRLTKVWPLDRYAGLAIRWCDQTGGSVIVFSALSETQLAERFYTAIDEKTLQWYQDRGARHAVRNRIHSEVQIDLRLMASIMANSRIYIGNDSGPKHLAVATGIPTISFFGPEDPFEWHPYPTKDHPFLYIEGLSCRNDQDPGMKPWCGLHECKIEEHRCMRNLSEDQAFSLLRKQVPELLT